MVRIEPVPRARQDQALSLLTGGRGSRASWTAVEAFSALLSDPEARRCLFWWARTLRGPRASAMTVCNPGRAAFVFHTPADSASAPADLISQLVGELTAATLEAGAAFAQAIVPVHRQVDAEMLARAGYERLARLIYLERQVGDLPPAAGDGLEWATVEAAGEAELGAVIAETYAGSLDCPGLLGRRPMADVVAGHKHSGTFRPRTWLLPRLRGQRVGCVLMNASADDPRTGEIVYLGVCPAQRRRGFARAMLRRALRAAGDDGMRRVALAADSANAPALALYRSEGFVQTDRRDVYARYAAPPAP